MKHPSLNQATENLGLPAGSPRSAYSKDIAADREFPAPELRSPGAAQCRVGDYRNRKNEDGDKKIEHLHRFFDYFVMSLLMRKPTTHATAVARIPHVNTTRSEPDDVRYGTIREASDTSPITTRISDKNFSWGEEGIRVYNNAQSIIVKLVKNIVAGFRNKKILATTLGTPPHLYYRCGGVLVFAVLMWGMSPPISVAANPAIDIIKGTATKLGEAGVTIAAIYAILGLLQGILSLGLGIVGGFLDFAFNLNVVINPGQLAVVQSGWTLLRDLANGLFILLLLWIAITIIFNLEGLGGKKLLVRVILVALLINFSLAMVSTVFAFGNELARPFAKAMGVLPTCTAAPCEKPKTTLSQLIINNSQIHETTKVVVDEGALERAQKELEAAGKQPPPPVEPFTGGQSSFRSIGNYLGAPPTAYAFAFVPILVYLGWAAAGAIASALATSLMFIGAHALGIDAWVFKQIFNVVVADAFLFLTISAMFTAAVVLLLRLVAMVFLGVFAPIAFLGLAFPKYGNLAWSKWIDNLVRWTFTAPIFYFLLYLSLLMLQANRSGGEAVFKEIPFTANFFKMLNLVLFLVFLWAAVYMTKKTAGHFADVALGLGRKGLGFGLGVATGFVARGAGALALRGQKQIEKGFGALGKVGIGIPIARRTEAYIQRQKKRAMGIEDEFKDASDDYLRDEYERTTLNAPRKAAIARVLARRGRLHTIKGGAPEALRVATGIGMQEEILKTAPGLATQKNVPGASSDQDAVNKILGKLSADELAKTAIPVDDGTKENKEGRERILQGLLTTIKGRQQLERIARENYSTYTELEKYWNGTTKRGADDVPNQTILEDALTETNKNVPGMPKNTEGAARARDMAQVHIRGMDNYFRLIPGRIFGRAADDDDDARRRRGGGTPTINPRPIPIGYVGKDYQLQLNTSGGSGNHTWRLAGGTSLPAGLTLNPATGLISGSPSAPGPHPAFSVEIVDNTSGTVSPPRSFTIPINP